MEQYAEQLNRRKYHKEQTVKYKDELDALFKERYGYSFNELMLDQHMITEAERGKIVLNKTRGAAVGQWKQLMIDNDIAYDVYKEIDAFNDWDNTHSQLDEIIKRHYEHGVKYLNSDTDVRNLYHKYEQHKTSELMLKTNANSSYGNMPQTNFGANK